MPCLRRLLLVAVLSLLPWGLFAQNTAYNPPAGYYAAAEGLNGTALKAALHGIIRNHRIIPYTSFLTDAWDALKELDEDPANPANVRLIYSGGSVPKWDTSGDGNPSISEDSWEREHLWVRSSGVGSTGADTSDLFNLRPIRGSVNSSRNNRLYDQADPFHPTDPARTPPNCPECLYDYYNGQGSIWTPRPSEKGDLARAMFYMAVRYDGRDADTVDLELSDDPNAPAGVFGYLSTLLQWHIDDPVNEEERLRNHLVYTKYQYNRNPFVDRPEMVAKVFGTLSELPGLFVTLTPSVVAEGAVAQARVSIAVAVANPVIVQLYLAGAASAEISLPQTVTITPGQTFAPFSITALADGVADGDKLATVIAVAANYESGAAVVSVLDAQGSSTGATTSISITNAGYYTQNFNSLPASGTNGWTDNGTLTGWYAERTGTGTNIAASAGATTTGGLYSFGTNSDRALGSIGSSSAGSFAWGVAFRNATDQAITLTTLSYVGEQWRNSGATNPQAISFSYQIGSGAAALTPGSDTGWNLLTGLDFTSPVVGGTAAALSGNAAANRQQVSSDLYLLLPPGAWITLRWRDINHTGDDHGLAIDDFRLDWSVPPSGQPPALTSAVQVVGQLGVAFNFQLAASNGPQFFEVEGLPAGLLYNSLTGVISGTPETAGVYDLTVLAVNASGATTSTMVLTVEKGLPQITTLPAASAIKLGQALSASSLTGGTAGVPGTFVFDAPATLPPFGINRQAVTFRPADTANYRPVALQIPVTVNYQTGFEAAAKSSYTAGNVTADGVVWNFDDALIGTDSADVKNAARAARLRNSAITMPQNLPAGIADISFLYARSNFTGDRTGTSPLFAVEYSTDQGATWTQAGPTVNLAGVDALTAFTATINTTGPTRLRLRKLSGTADKRWNVDDLVVTPYAQPPPPVPVITSPSAATGRVGTSFSYQITATGDPDFYEADDLPPGLALDPLVPGRITGTPSAAGFFAVALRAVNVTGEDTATLTLGIDGTTFGEWSGGAPQTEALVRAYALGGAAGPGASGEWPLTSVDAAEISITAIVRTDDAGLLVRGESSPNLASPWSTADVVEQGAAQGIGQAGVPAGCERRRFSIPRGAGPAKFLRLRIELAP